MKTLKKLKVAAAVATMFASVAGVHAASVSQSGATLAMETIKPGTLASPQSNFTRVRAPAVTFSYNNGPDVQATGEQKFEIVFTLGNGGVWSFATNAAPFASGELPAALAPNDGSPGVVNPMNLNAQRVAETISAKLRGANAASRVGVSHLEPADGNFRIVLRSIDKGNTLPGSSLAVHPNNETSVTYRFALVNKSNAPVALSDLDITFNSAKTPGVIADYFTCGAGGTCRQQLDSATTNLAEFGAINNLASLVQEARGHEVSAGGCTTEQQGVITLRANAGINNFQGTEEFLNLPAMNIPTFNPAYLRTARATDIILGAGPNRLIATTNSFAENGSLGGFGPAYAPTNGVGGLGGGRYTFVPTTKAQLTPGFGAGVYPTVNPAVPVNPTLSASSGDERDAVLGTVRFSNRGVFAADRLLTSDAYRFKGPNPAPLSNGNAFDFGTPTTPNLLGGVDIHGTASNALRIVVTQTGTRIGTTLRLIDLRAGIVNPADPSRTCADTGNQGATFTPDQTATPGVWNWDFTHQQLMNAVTANGGTATLAGKTLSVCYRVPGNETIPAVAFTNATATLIKDDITEQSLVSCPSPLTQIYGGVKIDVRNFSMAPDPFVGLLRIINNSETDTAKVDGQYIWNDGAYGWHGTLVQSLPPRGSVYVTSPEVLQKLRTPTTAVANGRNLTVRNMEPNPANLDANNVGGSQGLRSIRIRVSADVPTLRVQNYIFNSTLGALTEVSSSQGADFVNIESSNRDHIDQDAQTDIKK